MAKKAKKPIFDKRAPGSKMIVYGAILVLIGAVVNAYMSWTLSLGVSFGAATTKDVLGTLISLCLQVALSMLVAIDGINNRNRPSKGRSVMINAICVVAISAFLLIQNASYSTSIIIAGVSIAGGVVMAIGGFKNRRVFGNGK